MVGQVADILSVRELDAEGEGVVEPSPHTSCCSCTAAVVVSAGREGRAESMLCTSRCAFEAAMIQISIQRSIHKRTQSPAESEEGELHVAVQGRAAEGWEHSPRKITSINVLFRCK